MLVLPHILQDHGILKGRDWVLPILGPPSTLAQPWYVLTGQLAGDHNEGFHNGLWVSGALRSTKHAYTESPRFKVQDMCPR